MIPLTNPDGVLDDLIISEYFFVMQLRLLRLFLFFSALGWLMIVEGINLFVSGLRLGIGPFPFYGDVSAYFIGGAGILFFARAARL